MALTRFFVLSFLRFYVILRVSVCQGIVIKSDVSGICVSLSAGVFERLEAAPATVAE